MQFEFFHPRDAIAMAMARIYSHRLTTTCGGNVSILDEAGDMWITPAGVDKGALTPRDIVRVRQDGSCEGRWAPSSECPLHRAVYAARPDLRAIIHAHPMSLVAFSVSGKVPETRTLPQAWRWNGPVAFASWEPSGSEELGESVGAKFAEGAHSVILQNHGAVCGGACLHDAFSRFDTLEVAARAEIRARMIGIPKAISADDLALAASHGMARFGELPVSRGGGSLQEREARERICECVERCLRQRLFLPSVGSMSVRTGPDSFVVTPHSCDRISLRPDDLVLVRGARAETGKTPSSLARLYDAIYISHPEINAVIGAAPLNVLAFSMCRKPVPTRSLPDAFAHVGDVTPLSFSAAYSNPAPAIAKLSLRTPVLQVDNHGAVVVGEDLLGAYNALDVLENAADAFVGAAALR